MDQETAVMTAIIILICAFPFVLLGLKQRSKKQGMLNKIKTLATAQGCTITESSCEAGIAIGIDGAAGRLFFYKSLDEGEQLYQIDLGMYGQCSPLKATSLKGKGNDKYEVIDKLGLSLKPRDKSKDEAVVILYDANESAHLGTQIQLMEKWVAILNANLKVKGQAIQKPIMSKRA